MDHNVKALVLAAGKGTRLQTEGIDLPKVMRQADGHPLLYYVLRGLSFLPPEDIILVVGWKPSRAGVGAAISRPIVGAPVSRADDIRPYRSFVLSTGIPPPLRGPPPFDKGG